MAAVRGDVPKRPKGAAVKAAVMAEDSAATSWLALQLQALGAPIPISQENLDRLHYRYTHVYGQ